jgi:DNA-binding response OmpR family regulator
VILLDLGLPDADGTDLCRTLRDFSDAYIVMLTSRDDEVDKVLGLKLGADDYVTKPYSPREVLARIEALLRRPRVAAAAAASVERRIGGLVVQPESHRATVDGSEVELTRIEFGILEALTQHPERTVSRQALCERVWGDDWVHDDHVVDVHIANLRKKIDRDGVRHIRTVRGVGYRMNDLPAPDSAAVSQAATG